MTGTERLSVKLKDGTLYELIAEANKRKMDIFIGWDWSLSNRRIVERLGEFMIHDYGGYEGLRMIGSDMLFTYSPQNYDLPPVN